MSQNKKRLPARLKKLLDEAEDERCNATSRLAMYVTRDLIERAVKQDEPNLLRLASEWCTQAARAEKNRDTETLMELQRRLDELSGTSNVEDL